MSGGHAVRFLGNRGHSIHPTAVLLVSGGRATGEKQEQNVSENQIANESEILDCFPLLLRMCSWLKLAEACEPLTGNRRSLVPSSQLLGMSFCFFL